MQSTENEALFEAIASYLRAAITTGDGRGETADSGGVRGPAHRDGDRSWTPDVDGSTGDAPDETAADTRSAAGRGERSFIFWGGRARLSVSDIEILYALMNGPLRACEIAFRLDRDLEHTRSVLDMLSGLGIVEAQGDMYANTPAAIMYCRTIGNP